LNRDKLGRFKHRFYGDIAFFYDHRSS
jgi:hypothetical protein